MAVKLLVATVLMAPLMATPAFAAPQWVEDTCWHNAVRVRPALGPREREGYIANCIADWTAGTPPKRLKYPSRNRY
jgi:hypothetical protein